MVGLYWNTFTCQSPVLVEKHACIILCSRALNRNKTFLSKLLAVWLLLVFTVLPCLYAIFTQKFGMFDLRLGTFQYEDFNI